jgi:hypothetical protein
MLKQSACDIPEDQANDSRWGFWFAEIVGRLCRDQEQARAIYSSVMHVTKTRERNNDDEADDQVYEAVIADAPSRHSSSP